MKDIMKEHIPKTTFDSWPPRIQWQSSHFGSHLFLVLRCLLLLLLKKLLSLHIRTGMRRWKWAPRWCHLDFCNWTWHFADGALAHCFEEIWKTFPSYIKLWRPSVKLTHRHGKHINSCSECHQKFAGFFRGYLSFRRKYISNLCDVSTLCRLLRYSIILI